VAALLAQEMLYAVVVSSPTGQHLVPDSSPATRATSNRDDSLVTPLCVITSFPSSDPQVHHFILEKDFSRAGTLVTNILVHYRLNNAFNAT
jgi:hypothetical protein